VAIEVANRVGAEMAAEPEWADRLLEAPRYFSVVSLTFDGAIIRIRGRVVPAAQWAAASELRRRLALALAEARIDSARWDALGATPATDPANLTGGPAAGSGSK
jgi:moderate conductance mechanosensitive channel